MATISTPIHSGYTIINGSISGGSSSKIGTWMEYKVVSQSITNNTSTIRFYVFLATLSGSYNVYANNHSGTNRGAMSVAVGGSTVYTREKNGFATGTAVSASNYTTQYSTGYSSASGKPFLTVLTDNASTEAAAYGECTVTHNADGTKSVTLAWSGDCSFSSSIGVITGSATISLPTIPRATTPSVGTLTMGTASTITLSPASSTFTHTLRYTVGSASGTIITKTANTSVSWTPALTLANQVPNATTAVGTLYCDTYSGSTLIGTKSVSITLNVPASVIPSATYTLTDSNSAIATKFSAFIQSKSKVKVAITASGAYGSTIASVTTTINGTTYTGTSFTTDFLTGSGTQSISITIKDSRSRTKTVSGTFSVLAYKSPSVTDVAVFRCNSSGVASHTGTYASVKLKVTVTSLNSKNDASIVVQSKRKTETSYSNLKTWTGSYSVNGTYVVGGSLSNQYAYDKHDQSNNYHQNY